MKKILLLLILLVVSLNIKASENEIYHEIFDSVLSQSQTFEFFEKPGNKINLEVIRLRIRSTIGFEIPVITKFSLKPEIEFYWKK